LLAGFEELPVGLVDVGLHLGELLDSPLRDVNQHPHLLPGLGVQPRDCSLELLPELAVVSDHEMQDVDDFVQPLRHQLLCGCRVERQLDEVPGLSAATRLQQ